MTGRRVVVVGSGAAGLVAAVAAAGEGASVTLLEAAAHVGGTTAISGGGIWIAANPWAAAEGVVDTREAATRYLRALALGDADGALADAYVADGVRAAQGVERLTALRWQMLHGFPDYHAELDGGVPVGRSLEIEPVQVPLGVLARVRPDPYLGRPLTINEDASPPDAAELERRDRAGIATTGRGLVAGLLHALLELGGDVRTGVRVQALRSDGTAVVGVVANGEQLDGSVVIASGGFERDEGLVRSFLRGPMLAPAGPPSNRGDGLRMGMAVGAALGNMSEAWWCPGMHVAGEEIDGEPFWRMLFLDLAKPGSLLLDAGARRFVDEATNYNELGRALQELDGPSFAHPRVPSWAVFDSTPQDRPRLGTLASQPEREWLVRAATLDELARRTGLPAAGLHDSVERYNAAAARGRDDDFGRGQHVYDRFSGGPTLRALTEPPYYAVRVVPGCLGTKGGLRIDAHGRVLRASDGAAIPGLHAAGNASASLFGCAYPGGGATIGPALVFGWAAGQAAAA